MGIRNDPELVDWLASQKWSKFAQSLAFYYDAHGFLTDKQHAAATRLRNRIEELEEKYGVEPEEGPEGGPGTRAE